MKKKVISILLSVIMIIGMIPLGMVSAFAEDSTSAPCLHENTGIVGAKDATCTVDGYTGDTVCSDCGETVSVGEVIPALGHNYTFEVKKEPTCVENGLTVYYCLRCNISFDETTNKTGIHSWIQNNAATHKCENCNTTASHTFVNGECVCGKKEPGPNEDYFYIKNTGSVTTTVNWKNAEYGTAANLEYSTDTIGTGTTVNVLRNGEVIDVYTTVLFGDVNGDGIYDGTDSVIVNCLANGLLSREQVGEAVYTAADCNHDGAIDCADVVLLERAGLRLVCVNQCKSPEELMTDSAFVEYLNLIDQTVENEPTTPEIEPARPEPLIFRIVNAIALVFWSIVNFFTNLFD